MPMSHRLASIAVFAVLPFFAHADSQCDDGTQVNVSGRITTINTSPTRQAGQICVTLTKASGQDVFDQCGALLGTVVTSNQQTGSTTLNHTALFSKRQAFTTRNDVAQITGIQAVDASGVPCAFSVVEKINRITWSTGLLQTCAVDITAVGTTSTCADKNINTLTLTGKVCIKEKD